VITENQNGQGMGMIDKLIIVAAIGGVAYLMLRGTRKQSEGAIQPILSQKMNPTDWLDEVAYEVLARKLKIEKSSLIASISNNEHSVITKCREVINGAQWAFIREGDKSQVKARLEMAFTDGTSSKTEIQKHWDDIPSFVRAEFLKTGNHSLSKEWVLPNANKEG